MIEFDKGKETHMRKIGIGFFLLIMATTSLVSAQDSQTVSLNGEGDAWVIPLDCGEELPVSIPTEVFDPYLGIQEVVASVSTLPCSENGGVDCPNGYKVMANIQINRGCGPQYSTKGYIAVQDPDLEYVDCDAQVDSNGFAILASFIDYGPEGSPSRLIKIGKNIQGSPEDPSDDSGFVKVYINSGGEWKCHRLYGVDYEGRRVTCR
jgi:hypothetical protein